jgi:hypothetical protein
MNRKECVLPSPDAEAARLVELWCWLIVHLRNDAGSKQRKTLAALRRHGLNVSVERSPFTERRRPRG